MSVPVFDLGVDHTRRELRGYGADPPDARWPNGARVALSFVLNYEEGGEHTGPDERPGSQLGSGGGAPGSTAAPPTVDGKRREVVWRDGYNDDAHTEVYLTEGGAAATVGNPRVARNLGVESGFEYGSRRGFWRVVDLFRRSRLRFTSWAVGRAVELNPDAVRAMEEAGGEVASHSYRWIDYHDVPEEEERRHVQLAIDAIRRASPSGSAPVGWYTGRQSLRTRRIVYETYRERGLLDKLYDSDAYDEDLPYYVASPSPSTDKPSPPLLVVPYTLDNNDMKFGVTPGFSTSEHFYTYLVDALDVLLAEAARRADDASGGGRCGISGVKKMMTVGLHCRIVGRPGRFRGLERFVEHVLERQAKGEVWVATRGEIADHWRRVHPPPSS